MEPGPLPPHERAWRHPSELGPTAADVDIAANGHVMALAGGALAVLAVAVLVVSMTPRSASGPVAISATTTPSSPRSVVTVATRAPSTNTVQIRLDAGAVLTSFAAFPHTVAAGPELDIDGTEIAARTPDDDDMVLVRTEAVTYRLLWAQAKKMTTTDGTVVFDLDGALVAYVSRGELVNLVGD